jgi:hypothetical protein
MPELQAVEGVRLDARTERSGIEVGSLLIEIHEQLPGSVRAMAPLY